MTYTGPPANETPAERVERFRTGNDQIWGEGQWMACDEERCRDHYGKPSFHHRDAHSTRGVE